MAFSTLLVRTGFAALAIGLAAAPALPREVPGEPSIEAAAMLMPSDFIWNDIGPDARPVRVIVSIADQRAYVFRGTDVIAVTSVSTGRPGHETPAGVFPVLQKDVTHHSNKYSNAPMPFMQRLTWDGIALHAGHNPGYAASHGCVRLPLEFAKRLFAVTEIGAQVLVTDEPIELIVPPSTPRVQPIPVIPQAQPPLPQLAPQMILASATASSSGDVQAIRAALASVRRSSSGASVDAMVSLVY